MYLQMAVFIITGAGIFFFLDSFLKVSLNKLTAFSAASAFNIFYWFAVPVLLGSLGKIVITLFGKPDITADLEIINNFLASSAF